MAPTIPLAAHPQAPMDWMPVGRALTVDNLDHSPDDGRRYELFDGVLVVSPSPIWAHQAGGGELFVILKNACPRDLRVVVAPFDWRISRSTQVIPDIVVARYADLAGAPGRKYLDAAPLLVVEVLSHSTRRFDRTLKMSTYAAAGAASYWLVDPDPDQPSVATFRLGSSGAYEPGPTARGKEMLHVSEPFHLSLRPWDLLTDLRE